MNYEFRTVAKLLGYEECKLIIAYFGTYSVNEADMVVTAKVEASTFAGMVGDPDQKRVITLITEDELKLSNPASTTGGNLS